jgi:hypothetical protein
MDACWNFDSTINLQKGVEEIMKTMISKTFFQDCVVVGHALLEGFWFPMASLQV